MTIWVVLEQLNVSLDHMARMERNVPIILCALFIVMTMISNAQYSIKTRVAVLNRIFVFIKTEMSMVTFVHHIAQ